MKKFLKWGIIVAAIVIGIGVVVLQWQTGLVLPSPEIDLAKETRALPRPEPDGAATSETPTTTSAPAPPAIRFVLDPEVLEQRLPELLDAYIPDGHHVPQWLAEGVLPRSAAGVVRYDFDAETVYLDVLINTKRGDTAFARYFPMNAVRDAFPGLRWDTRGLRREKRGLLSLQATADFAPEIDDDVWHRWRHDIEYPPLELNGDHVFEAVFDNRSGGAWLVIASLFHAFDYELDDNAQDISLSSLQFVKRGRCSIDTAGKEDLRIRMALDILPEHVNKVGVHNLKGGLEEAFTELARLLQENRGVELTGGSDWEGDTLVFEYTLSDWVRAVPRPK